MPNKLTAFEEMIQQGACERLAAIVMDQEHFRHSLGAMSVPDLLGTFGTLKALIDILEAESPSDADMAVATFSDLMGMCQVEATRRGSILHAGDDKAGDLVAKLVAERLLGKPLPNRRCARVVVQ